MQLPINQIICADCLEYLPELPENSIDLILSDLPYGVTNNSEDKPLDLDKLWDEYKRIIKDSGNIVLTAQFPFTLDVINKNLSWFRYDLVWDKELVSGHLNSNKQPLRCHEYVLVFYEKFGTYNPQKTLGRKNHKKGASNKNSNYNGYDVIDNKDKLGPWKHPRSILKFPRDAPSKTIHPTQKPLRLFEFLVKSYSNENDVVLDNCIGSGTTAEACIRSNRDFIGIDINPKWVEYSLKRIESVPQPLTNYPKLTEAFNRD